MAPVPRVQSLSRANHRPKPVWIQMRSELNVERPSVSHTCLRILQRTHSAPYVLELIRDLPTIGRAHSCAKLSNGETL